jgi:hypothetical protein
MIHPSGKRHADVSAIIASAGNVASGAKGEKGDVRPMARRVGVDRACRGDDFRRMPRRFRTVANRTTGRYRYIADVARSAHRD